MTTATSKPDPEQFAPLTSLLEMEALAPHPIAEQDDLMNSWELDSLKASIKVHGIREPITLFRENSRIWILDGRNRWRAAKAVGHRFTVGDFRVFSGTLTEAAQLANDANDIRRHLTPEQRKKKAARLVKQYPGLSTRTLAAMAGVSHSTIAELKNQEKEDDGRLRDFVKRWDNLPIADQERFVQQHRVDLSEMLKLSVSDSRIPSVL
jgi:ParB/RepB/Spo0J family partition protein